MGCGPPDAYHLAEIIAGTGDYIRRLPAKGVPEHYFDDDLWSCEGQDEKGFHFPVFVSPPEHRRYTIILHTDILRK